MRFVKPSVDIITEPDLFKRIEIGARTCYKSEDKITDDSAEKMVKALIRRGHESPLEHSNIIAWFNMSAFTLFEGTLLAYTESTNLHHFIHVSAPDNNFIYCGGNLRAWRALAKETRDFPLIYELFGEHPAFKDLELKPTQHIPDTECGLLNGPCGDSSIDIVTARFICDRGVSHELVRHRVASFSQESTRYVNYEDGLTLVEPWWWPEQETTDTAFIRASCQAAEDAYRSLISSGASPQKARCVLPNMLKTEVVMTATIEQWQTLILPLRLSKAAHPDIRRLMEMFCEKMNWNPDDYR